MPINNPQAIYQNALANRIPIVGAWISFTPTGSWTTNTTYSGRWRRVGDTAEIQWRILLSGAPNPSTVLELNLPTGLLIDSTKLASGTEITVLNGNGQVFQNSSNNRFVITPIYSTASAVAAGVGVITTHTGTVYPRINFVDSSTPITFGTNDRITLSVKVPIQGWLPEGLLPSIDPAGFLVTQAGVQTLTNKDYDGGTASNFSRITVPQAPFATLQTLTRKEATILYANDLDRLYVDNGTSLVAVGTGSGSINYCTNPDAEASISGWVKYANNPGPAPTNGTGGNPVINWQRTTSSPLEGSGSFLLSKPGGDHQGNGVSFDFTIAPADLGKQITVSFIAQSNSGYVANDVLVYVIADPSGTPEVIQLTPAGIPKADSTGGALYTGTFQAGPTATSYRLCFHVATNNAASYELKIDRVSIAPSPVAFAAAVTDPTPYTPTLNSNTGVAANNARWWRAGRYMMIEGAVRYNGTGAASNFYVTLPAGYTIDSSSFFGGNDIYSQVVGFWGWYDSVGSVASRGGVCWIQPNSPNIVQFVRNDNSSYVSSNDFGANDRIVYQLRIPIAGWGSNVQIGSYDGRTVAFRAQAATTTLSGSETTINYTSIQEDTHGGYNAGEYTVPVAGYYNIAASISTASAVWVASNTLAIRIQVNGSNIAQRYERPASFTGSLNVSIAISSVRLNAGDVVRISALSSQSVACDGTNMTNFFSISLVPGRSTLAAGDYVPPKVTRYTSGSGTHTVADNVKYIRVRMVGGGGGGGGNSTTQGAFPGVPGGGTTFGTRTAGGGGAGSASIGALGGVVSGSGYTIVAEYQGTAGGRPGINPSTANGTQMPGGVGGSSFFGGGGQNGAAGGDGLNAIANSGSGGGGGGTDNVANQWGGGGGGSGAYLEFIIENPAPSYSYSVGAGGAGSTGASRNGGAGGSGIIIVEEYFR